MQLSKVSIKNTSTFEFKDPYTLESFDTPIKVTLHSIKSKHGKQCEHTMRLQIIKAMEDESNMVIDGDNKNLKPDLIREISFNMLSELIVSWEGIEDDKGKVIKFTKEEAVKAFHECEEFADALYIYSGDVGNFRKE